MTQRHTPGPWAFDGKQHVYYPRARLRKDESDVIGGLLANVGGLGTADMPTLEANARLIAAAPDLLAALEGLRGQLRQHVKMDVKKHYSLMIAEMTAGKAIAKATGEGE